MTRPPPGGAPVGRAVPTEDHTSEQQATAALPQSRTSALTIVELARDVNRRSEFDTILAIHDAVSELVDDALDELQALDPGDDARAAAHGRVTGLFDASGVITAMLRSAVEL